MSPQSWFSYLRPQRLLEAPAWFRWIVAAVSGALLSASFYGEHPSFFSWFCVAMLVASTLGAPARVAFVSGFLHGLMFVVTCVPWIAEVLAVHGGMSLAAGWGVLLLIATVWGASIGLFGWMVQRLARRNLTLALIGFPFLWISTEVLRTYLPEISFPWGLLGYPAAGNPALVQLTTMTGIYGVSFLVAGFNALLLWSALGDSRGRRRRMGILAATILVLLAVCWIGPRFVPKAEAHHTARVVQPNFPEQMEYAGDWYAGHQADLTELERLSLRPSASALQPDILLWPEAPAPFSFQDPHFGPFISRLAGNFGHPVIAGVIEWKAGQGTDSRVPGVAEIPYNSAVMVNRYGQRVFSYDKIHLVPFGEYEPFPFIHQVVTSVSQEVGGFHKGTRRSVGKFDDGETFSVFICYEAIYAGEIREFVRDGAGLLFNISNDGWFGKSAAAEQHLRMVRVRAVENRRWILRDTNSGITASIDPYGNVTRVMSRDTRDSADLAYDLRTDETVYSRFGDWFAWMCVAVSAILVVLTFRKA
ncbi:MAG TPA: apolipoprotein N-acyltransferase [Candidatus Acidoferrum sp.]